MVAAGGQARSAIGRVVLSHGLEMRPPWAECKRAGSLRPFVVMKALTLSPGSGL